MLSEQALEKRLAEIEIKLSYSEDLIETLNHTVYKQQSLIEHLLKEVRFLREQRPAEDGQTRIRDLRDEIPPHY